MLTRSSYNAYGLSILKGLRPSAYDDAFAIASHFVCESIEKNLSGCFGMIFGGFRIF